jgi:hypothetical protein
MTDVDALCSEYLKRLDEALRDRSVPQRQQIVEQITEHLNEARAELTFQSEPAVRSILERLGSPETIATAAAAGDDANEAPSSGRWFKRRRGIPALAGVVVLVALGLAIGLFASRDATPSRTSISRTLAPGTSAIGTTTVPVVLGESIAEATAAIEASGLTVQGIEGTPDGPVVSQDPSGGSRVPPGSSVTLHT